MELLIRRNKEGDIILKDADGFRTFDGTSARIDFFIELEKALRAQDEVLQKVRERQQNG